jgi:uncharacterized protein YukE
LDGVLSVVIDFLSHSFVAVATAAVLIVGAALAGYFTWFRPAAVRLQSDLRRLAKALEVSGPDPWPAAREQARAAVKTTGVLQTAWTETDERVVALAHGPRPMHVMFGSARDIWSGSRLLGRTINLPLAEAVPNLLVGVGLLMTFVFLTIALSQATAALVGQGGQSTDLMGATRGLLSAAGAKFMTSLAGLLASIAWTIGFRRRMARLHAAAEDVVVRIGRLASPAGAEWAVAAQVQQAGELQRTAAAQVEISKEISTRTGHHSEVTEELLNEAREQTGTFKRFETDLAVSLAGAITKAFSPQMEAMTERLVTAVNSLSDRLGTMNQDALQKMMSEFGGMLKAQTDSEMAQLRQTLTELSSRLAVAGETIGTSAGTAAEKLDRAGSDLLTRVEQVSGNLESGAKNLEGATQGVKEAMNDLDVTIRDAAGLGREGAAVVKEALTSAEAQTVRLKAATEDLSNAGAALERMSGRLAEAVDSVDEMTREQRAVVDAVRTATPQALGSVERVVDLLQETVRSTSTTMNQTRDAMAKTSATLGTTVTEITTGVREYSGELAKLHKELDAQLSRAVGSLDKTIRSLEEAVDELSETLDSRAKA